LSLPVNDILQSDKQRPFILTVAHATNSQLALVPVLILTGSFSVYENPGSGKKKLGLFATSLIYEGSGSGIRYDKKRPDPEPQSHMAATAPAPNLMFNIGGLLKMSQIITAFYFSIHIFNHFNHTKIEGKSSPNF
jgi:hypothetical protein